MKLDDWRKLNGREIQQIHWPDSETATGQQLTCTPTQKLFLHSEYLGDRTESWVVCIRDGRETARYNAKMLETIVWGENPS